jgi:hypothetical protein
VLGLALKEEKLDPTEVIIKLRAINVGFSDFYH